MFPHQPPSGRGPNPAVAQGGEKPGGLATREAGGGIVSSVHLTLALRGPREQATALPPDATGHSVRALDRTWQKLASPAERRRRGAQRHRSPTPRPRPFLPSRAPRWLGRWAAVGADSDRAWSRNAAPWGVGGMACRNHVRVPPTLARIYISASAPPSAVACMQAYVPRADLVH